VREANADRRAEEIERLERAARRERLASRRAAREEQAAPADTGGDGSSGLAGFAKFARGLGGEVGVSAGPPGDGEPAVAGELTSGSAWSSIKVPIAMRVLAEGGGPDGITAAQKSQILRALTASDNAAASQLFHSLGSTSAAAGSVTEVLREAGDQQTQVSTQGRASFSPYGQTEWSLAAQHRFIAALAGGCVGKAPARRYVLGLMGQVSSDSWGLGSAGVPARWKGGWGPGTDGRYLARQMGVLEIGGKELVVTVAARASDGQFASAQELATRSAKWLADNAGGLAGSGGGC